MTDEQFLITTIKHQGRTAIHLPAEMVDEDGVYRELEADLRRAGLLLHAMHGSNQHILFALGAPEAQWAESLRRWLADPRPEALTRAVPPRD